MTRLKESPHHRVGLTGKYPQPVAQLRVTPESRSFATAKELTRLILN